MRENEDKGTFKNCVLSAADASAACELSLELGRRLSSTSPPRHRGPRDCGKLSLPLLLLFLVTFQ